jgi:hypothetical protein
MPAYDPRDDGQHCANRHDCPPGDIDGAQLKPSASIPEEMTDAAAKMQKEAEEPTEKRNLTGPRMNQTLHEGVALRTRRRSDQPRNQTDGVQAQYEPCEPMRE